MLSLSHHAMVHSRVEDGGDGLQKWKIAVNILNKKCRTADNRWSSSLRVRRLDNPYRKTNSVLLNVAQGLEHGRFFVTTWTLEN